MDRALRGGPCSHTHSRDQPWPDYRITEVLASERPGESRDTEQQQRRMDAGEVENRCDPGRGAAVYLPQKYNDRGGHQHYQHSAVQADPERLPQVVSAKHSAAAGVPEPEHRKGATPYEPWLLHQLAIHPKFVGGKVSTLDEPHFLYWAAMCKDLKLDFAPHSGDDYGIATAIKTGLPLLIGAASSAAPQICAAKDMWLDDGAPSKKFPTGTGRFDTRVYKLFEAFQSLEDQVFRLDAKGSAAAYKHSTAHLLHQLGVIASPDPHPACKDVRGANEAARMSEAMVRTRRISDRLGIPR